MNEETKRLILKRDDEAATRGMEGKAQPYRAWRLRQTAAGRPAAYVGVENARR